MFVVLTCNIIGNVENNQETDEVKRLHVATENGDTTHRLRQHGEYQQGGRKEEKDRGEHSQFAIIYFINDEHADVTEQQVFQMLQNDISAHTIDHDDRNGRQENHHNRDDIVRLQLDFSQNARPRGVSVGLHDNDGL